MNNEPTNYLTIDVEDYFQVAAFENIINPDLGILMRQELNAIPA